MHCSTKTRLIDLLLLFVFLLTGIIRILRPYFRTISDNTILYILYVMIIFIWLKQIRKRLLNREERKYLTGVAIFILIYLLLRTIKFVYVLDDSTFARYLWYLYYLPQTLMVLYLFFAILYLGKPYHYVIKSRLKLLYFPAIFIIIGILTNDYHQLAFFFPKGIDYWNDIPYIHGIFYYLAISWIIIFFLMTLIITIIRCSISMKRKNIWIPLSPLLIGFFYMIAFTINRENLLQRMWKTSEVICFILIAFIECLILAGLFPSNDNYENLWKTSSIQSAIMDKTGKLHYQSNSNLPVTLEEVKMALSQEVLLKDTTMVLRSHIIKGGYGYWIKDRSEINRLNEKLKESANLLQEENDLLDAENKLREKRLRIQQKNRLYDDIAKSVHKQLNEIEKLLQYNKNFDIHLKYACILNVYVKRYSNLLLLSDQNSKIHSDELWFAITESLQYAKLYGIYTGSSYYEKQFLNGKDLILTYQIFEEALEQALPNITTILVNLDVCKGIKLHIEIDHPSSLLDKKYNYLQIEYEDDTEYITFYKR